MFNLGTHDASSKGFVAGAETATRSCDDAGTYRTTITVIMTKETKLASSFANHELPGGEVHDNNNDTNNCSQNSIIELYHLIGQILLDHSLNRKGGENRCYVFFS